MIIIGFFKNIFFIIIPLFLFCFSLEVRAQDTKKIPVLISIFNNATALPGSGFLGVINRPVHPGFTVGTWHNYNTNERHRFFQTVRLGYFYHHYVQHAIQLYTETGYRFIFKNGIGAESRLGAGYVHSIPNVQIFKLNEDGEYVKKRNWGRPQFMASVALGLSYDLEKKKGIPLRLFLDYQFWLQLPFVKSYVPILPNSSLHLGVAFFINKLKK